MLECVMSLSLTAAYAILFTSIPIQMGLFIFMKRTNRAQDLDYLQKMLNYVRLSPNGPGLIIMYVRWK